MTYPLSLYVFSIYHATLSNYFYLYTNKDFQKFSKSYLDICNDIIVWQNNSVIGIYLLTKLIYSLNAELVQSI